MLVHECEAGEWWEIGALITERDLRGMDSGKPVDLTGCEATVTLNTAEDYSGTDVPGGSAWVADALNGLAAAGGRTNTLGRFYGVVTVTRRDANGDLPGWPKKARFELQVG